MKYSLITIEREYGSGGTAIACRLAEVCGIACYGQEILEAAARELGVSVEKISRYEETVTNSFLYTLTILSRVQSGESDMLSDEGHIFMAEQAVIKKMAEKRPAVFLGHCAYEALKNKKGVLNVFIRSDEQDKKRRIMADYGIPAGEAEATRKRFDKKRAGYYFANTARQWGDLKNYDMVLNSSRLGTDGCVTALKAMLR